MTALFGTNFFVGSPLSTNKLDIEAKQAFALQLQNEGHSQITVIKNPADLTSIHLKTGEKFYWEIKGTEVLSGVVFGAATAIELEAAISTPRYSFVIAQKVAEGWRFYRLAPEDFLSHCTLPPAKILFHYSLVEGAKPRKRRSAITATSERIKAIQDLFRSF